MTLDDEPPGHREKKWIQKEWRFLAKAEMTLVLEMPGGESKLWCCKEQYCIRIWKVRSMNQGKLDVVKEEMARVNIKILGTSELKWMGMNKFNSDDH